MRTHYLHITDLSKTDVHQCALRRFSHQSLHPNKISSIPGLNPELNLESEAKNQPTISSSAFVLRNGYKKVQIVQPESEKDEIPLVDQIINNRHSQNNMRPDILPVDEKTKLYFAYNRKNGTISKVIATAPRHAKTFAKK
uniref:Uncharacterized protein n=1 Tax=Clytia hemisphaerica TaxID=252671 RepID=A0A7M5X0G6_9CNID|eukprot:TCONS_00067507-protein